MHEQFQCNLFSISDKATYARIFMLSEDTNPVERQGMFLIKNYSCDSMCHLVAYTVLHVFEAKVLNPPAVMILFEHFPGDNLLT